MTRPIAGPRAEPRTRIRAKPRAEQERPTISFRANRVLLDEIDALAVRFGLTRNAMLENILATYLQDRTRKRRTPIAKIAVPFAATSTDIFA